ncbi:MAG: sugar nucleotide-binding protein [Candidatus Omnitrophota bacterium]|jgi:3,5-epimerase/4-reductase
MKNNILVFGKGFMGQRISAELDCALSDRRILTLQDALEEINKYKPDTVINCIGYTGKNSVDDCELELDKTLHANSFVPVILAEAALRSGVKLVHISSGCIYHYDYDSQPPIAEEDIPDFFDLYYSRSKIYSERALEALFKGYDILMLRIRIPLDNRPHPKNILNKLIKYKRVIDIPNSVTYVPDFLAALKHLLRINARGLYNLTNKGALRYPRLMKIYKRYKPDFQYDLVQLGQVLKTPRTNLIMSTDKLGKTGFNVRDINEVLEECVKEYVKY